MRNNSLTKTGLSLSQAQSISNLCNQRAIEITAVLTTVNNCSKTVMVDKVATTTVEGHKLPKNVVELLEMKSKFSACQAFLMENIKAKELMLNNIKASSADLSGVVYPVQPKFARLEKQLQDVSEEWGWEQLTAAEMNEKHEVEAYAAHIGRFIHKNGKLSQLRTELPTIPCVEWMVIKDGEKSPVTVTKHHKSEELLHLHEELAAIHRDKEQRVNYFKAKVKNLVTIENARIAKLNADEQNEVTKTNNDLQTTHETKMRLANGEADILRKEHEKFRQEQIKVVANLRINVDARFQSTVDEFLSKLNKDK